MALLDYFRAPKSSNRAVFFKTLKCSNRVGCRAIKCSNRVGVRAIKCSNRATGTICVSWGGSKKAESSIC